MKLQSPAFENNSEIPQEYTCLGENVHPPLAFKDIPPQAKSLVLFVEDVNASPVPWLHWSVFNIPAEIHILEKNDLPNGCVEGKANGGKPGYEGPCPKYFTGVHRYVFSLIALDIILDLPSNTDKSEITHAMEGHIVGEALLTGICSS